jgi:preprotein translocase subunit YajC
MMDVEIPPVIVAMAQAPGAQPNLLVQLFPFVLMLGIFYFLVLLPMRRRQKKVQEFQSALKVDDRVITTGGIHGVITRAREAEPAVQLQIAEKVRIEISRAAIAGYQGQEPVVQADKQGL